MFAGAVIAALLLGFLTGLFAFKVKSRWCPHCGGVTVPAPVRQPHMNRGPF